MTDRLREAIAKIDGQLRHLHLVRSTLNQREDRLLRQRQLIYVQIQLEQESEYDDDVETPIASTD